MKKYFRRLIAASLMVGSLILTPIVGAEIKNYTGFDDTSYVGELESPEIVKLRAIDKAKRNAQEKAGVCLAAYSRESNFRLTDDEIMTVTNNIVDVLNEERMKVVETNRETQRLTEENDRKAEELSRQVRAATSAEEKARIKREIEQTDREFLANQKLEEGNRAYYSKNYERAIELYNEALKLKPNFSWAYNNRGVAYANLKQYEQAIADFNKGIELNPNDAVAYYIRGLCYQAIGDKARAQADFDKAKSLGG